MSHGLSREDSRLILLDKEKWPNWPLMPMKRFKDGLETGLLHAGDAFPTIHFKNLFDLTPATAKPRHYDTIEELLNDGWEID